MIKTIRQRIKNTRDSNAGLLECSHWGTEDLAQKETGTWEREIKRATSWWTLGWERKSHKDAKQTTKIKPETGTNYYNRLFDMIDPTLSFLMEK